MGKTITQSNLQSSTKMETDPSKWSPSGRLDPLVVLPANTPVCDRNLNEQRLHDYKLRRPYSVEVYFCFKISSDDFSLW